MSRCLHGVFPFPLPSSAVGDVILVISRDISKKGADAADGARPRLKDSRVLINVPDYEAGGAEGSLVAVK